MDKTKSTKQKKLKRKTKTKQKPRTEERGFGLFNEEEEVGGEEDWQNGIPAKWR